MTKNGLDVAVNVDQKLSAYALTLKTTRMISVKTLNSLGRNAPSAVLGILQAMGAC